MNTPDPQPTEPGNQPNPQPHEEPEHPDQGDHGGEGEGEAA